MLVEIQLLFELFDCFIFQARRRLQVELASVYIVIGRLHLLLPLGQRALEFLLGRQRAGLRGRLGGDTL